MKKLLLLLFCFPFYASSQNCRYLDRIFSAYNKQSNVIYATAPGIPSFYLSESATTLQNLTVDIFEPTGDLAATRALIIFAHSGGFINGSKNNDDMQALCDSFAKRGYITASMNYRKNFNLFSGSSAERAVWRGTQDASTIVRYFKANASTYRIDTTKIFFWGSSAGAFMAVNLAYMDDTERPASTFSGTGRPDLGCKDCSGITTATHNSSVTGIISCWGAIGDTNWINSNNNVPGLFFHGTADNTVSFNAGQPFGLFTLPVAYGSNLMNTRLNQTPIYHEFYPAVGEGHEYWGTNNGIFNNPPTVYWQDILNKSKNFMYGRMGLVGSCAVLAVKYVKADAVKKDNETARISWTTSGLQEPGTKFIVQFSTDAQHWNPVQQLTVANTAQTDFSVTHRIKDIMGTIFYRVTAIEPNGQSSYSDIMKINNYDNGFSFSVYPNPASNTVNINLSNLNNAYPTVANLYNVMGVKVQEATLYSSSNKISIAGLTPGIYFIKLNTAASASQTVKLLVK